MNNKPQFMPGPWIVETTNTLPGECADNVHRLCYPGYRIHGICAIWNNTRTSKANATLIAAAPAMYEALAKLRLEAIHYRNTGVGVQFLNAAIDRAEVAINQAVGVTNDTARTS